MEAVTCLDCGMQYGGPDWLDTRLPIEQWRLIHPDDGGILCANCIVARAAKLPNVVSVCARIVFGPDYQGGDPCFGKSGAWK